MKNKFSIFNFQFSISSEKLVSAIKILLYCLAFTPLIITPMTIFPFNFGRGLVIQFLIEIIFGLYLVLAIFDKNYRPKKNSAAILFGSFIVWTFIASFLGADFNRSFWSAPERFTGWLYLLHIFIFFIILSAMIKTKDEWRRFLSINAAVSILMFFIAILSLFRVKFWGVDLGTRISGTLGNPIFLSAYFILSLIFILYLFFSEKRKGYKIIWFLCAAILSAGIFLTKGRGAFLGIIFGAVAGLFYYSLGSKNKKVKSILLSAIVLIIIAVGALVQFRKSGFVKSHGFLRRFSEISFSSASGNTRALGWQIALEAIREKPILGWGVEGYEAAFNKYYKPELLKYSYYETWFDKPHNKILEAAVDGGFVGLLLYLSIFMAGFIVVRKKQKSGELSLAAAASLIGGLAAYFTQNFFAFDTAVSYFLFFILLSFIMRQEPVMELENKKIPFLPAAGFLAIFGILGLFVNASPFLANAAFRKDAALLDAKDKISIPNFKRASAHFNPYKDEWRIDLAKNVIASLKRKDNLYAEEEINYVLEELKETVAAHPNDAYYHLLLGGLRAELGVKDAAHFVLAKEELGRALALSPKRQHVLIAYGRLYNLMRDREALVKVFNEAIALEPEAPLIYWEAFRQLYLFDSFDPLTLEWLEKGLGMGLNIADDGEFLFIFKNTYKYFLEKKNYPVLSNFYERMSSIEPMEAKWRAQNAAARYLMKDYDEAVNAIRKAIELDESYRKEGEEFIRLIEKES